MGPPILVPGRWPRRDPTIEALARLADPTGPPQGLDRGVVENLQLSPAAPEGRQPRLQLEEAVGHAGPVFGRAPPDGLDHERAEPRTGMPKAVEVIEAVRPVLQSVPVVQTGEDEGAVVVTVREPWRVGREDQGVPRQVRRAGEVKAPEQRGPVGDHGDRPSHEAEYGI